MLKDVVTMNEMEDRNNGKEGDDNFMTKSMQWLQMGRMHKNNFIFITYLKLHGIPLQSSMDRAAKQELKCHETI